MLSVICLHRNSYIYIGQRYVSDVSFGDTGCKNNKLLLFGKMTICVCGLYINRKMRRTKSADTWYSCRVSHIEIRLKNLFESCATQN